MRQDHNTPLKDIRGCGPRTLSRRLLEIGQGYSVANEKSLDSMKVLKCFRLAKPGGNPSQSRNASRNTPANTLEIVETDLFSQKYIAVSYCWRLSPGEDSANRNYRLSSSERRLKLRDALLGRIISYAKYISNQNYRREDTPFWIDQLSIKQQDRHERNVKVQAMDLVYKNCEAAVGCLWVHIKTQQELDTLGNLLRGCTVKESEQGPTMGANVDTKAANATLQFLLCITDDPWWQSAWAFQEDYISDIRMWLLIRCCSTLLRSDMKDHLGDLSGELVVNSANFRKYATLFCLAYRERMAQDPGVEETCNKILRKAGKYSVLHRYGRGATGNMIRKAMSPTVLHDLSHRTIRHASDIPTISANCLDYSIRLDPTRVKRSRSSLSICILALYLSNGEIINNNTDHPGKLAHDVFAFLQHQAISLEAPVERGELTFMKHCRFSNVKLLDAGIRARGMMWKVCRILPPNQLLPIPSSEKEETGSREYRHRRLQDLARLIRHLGYKQLAKDLENFLGNDQPPPSKRNEWASGSILKIMADHIVKAMDAGKPLQLGLPILKHPKSYSSYRAIFVRDYYSSGDPRKSFLFTSWSRARKDSSDGQVTRFPAKYVSLEVSRDGRAECGYEALRTKRWVNGLCFFDGERAKDFLFPWPRSLIE
ncbi:hypothetical protein BDV95DRAFT_280970 [Massariosphaeria phaeospora]|uniref:Heterokaryon incompatibility domain-containing protein n=1 Tax=Massariosphaeria phaeospora TaxID=100035 RepID=A0A7C8MSB8_9PLEO|nr:hypothetical protein BDV95DRAFT_280970 [Massariosphaeria phaeospora]